VGVLVLGAFVVADLSREREFGFVRRFSGRVVDQEIEQDDQSLYRIYMLHGSAEAILASMKAELLADGWTLSPSPIPGATRHNRYEMWTFSRGKDQIQVFGGEYVNGDQVQITTITYPSWFAKHWHDLMKRLFGS